MVIQVPQIMLSIKPSMWNDYIVLCTQSSFFLTHLFLVIVLRATPNNMPLIYCVLMTKLIELGRHIPYPVDANVHRFVEISPATTLFCVINVRTIDNYVLL